MLSSNFAFVRFTNVFWAYLAATATVFSRSVAKTNAVASAWSVLDGMTFDFETVASRGTVASGLGTGQIYGFGFEMTQDGAVMLPHLGLVEIADNVTIGSQTVIDRGVLGNTIIGRDVMIDNHVHIAHNVTIGDKTIILAQVGIAGSSNIGCNAIIGGQVGIKDHVEIADNVMVLSGSKVTKSLEKAGAYAGFPAQPAKQHWREMAQLKQLLSQKKSGE